MGDGDGGRDGESKGEWVCGEGKGGFLGEKKNLGVKGNMEFTVSSNSGSGIFFSPLCPFFIPLFFRTVLPFSFLHFISFHLISLILVFLFFPPSKSYSPPLHKYPNNPPQLPLFDLSRGIWESFQRAKSMLRGFDRIG